MKRIVVLLCGLLLIAAGIFLLVHGNAVKKRCTEPATGVVIGNKSEESIDDEGFTSHTYYPVIEYTAGDKVVSATASSGQNPPKYQEGDKVEILYNPADTTEFLIQGETGPGLFGIIMIAVGFIVSLIGVRVFIRGR